MMIPPNRKRMDPSLVEGFSALRCQYCNKHFTTEFERLMLVEYYAVHEDCGKRVDIFASELTILPRYQYLLSLKNAMKEKVWYHATDYDSYYSDGTWEESIIAARSSDDPFLVHIGSMESAVDRGEVSYADTLFTLRLRPEFLWSPEVTDDHNCWPEKFSDTQGEFGNFADITRYVNRYEIPGSVSLLVRADALSVVCSEPFQDARHRYRTEKEN